MYKNPYGANAYSQASQNVSPMKAVIMLYEGMIRLIGEAKKADIEQRFEDRFKAVEKASRVLLGLQSKLDFENGGDISPILHDFYDTLFIRMMQINSRNGQAVADDVLESLREMKQTWEKVAAETEGQGSFGQGGAGAGNATLRAPATDSGGYKASTTSGTTFPTLSA